MKKILILALALWTGTANFAYVSAKLECAAMMKLSVHACCPKQAPCQCSIQNPSNDQVAPSYSQDRLDLAPSDELAVISEISPQTSLSFEPLVFESPPKLIPFYQLFSVYRL